MSLTNTLIRSLRSAPVGSAVRVARSQLQGQAPRQVVAARTFTSSPLVRLSLSSPRFKVARSAWAKEPIVKYEELKPLTQQPTDDVLVVDVREPDEVALGSIPSAVNLPLSRLKDALGKSFNPGDFQREFAFPKPVQDQNIIFFCRSGKRSANAATLAGENGYHNVRNYEGSYLDWSARESQNKDDD